MTLAVVASALFATCGVSFSAFFDSASSIAFCRVSGSCALAGIVQLDSAAIRAAAIAARLTIARISSTPLAWRREDPSVGALYLAPSTR